MITVKNMRSLLVRVGAVGIAASFALTGASVSAVHENVEFPVAIHAGSCESPGEVVFELDNLVRLPVGAPEEGERVGAPGAQVVHGYDEDVDLTATVDDLFAADHIVAVFNAEGDTIVACGPIGAYTYEAGNDLAIGLREWNESNFSGAAFFDVDDDDDDDALGLDIFLVSSTLPPAATDGTPAATPTD